MRPIYWLLFLFLTQAVFSQGVNKVLISGLAGYEQHDLDVKEAFLQGYSSYNGAQFTGEITLIAQSIYSSFSYANSNDFPLIIRSTTGLSSGIYYAKYFPDVKLVMPSGSNNFQLTYSGDIETCPVIVTGAGDSSNATGYKIDFYSKDPITENNFSSYSNGYVAGQLAFIANTLNCTIDEARDLSRNKGNQNGVWDYYNGYGTVEIGAVIENPFPVELTSFTVNELNNGIQLNWVTATEINNYGFEIERAEVSSYENKLFWETVGFVSGHGNSNSPVHYNFVDGKNLKSSDYYYRLKQIDNDGEFEYSDKVFISHTSPAQYTLQQNYPNPFNPETTIEFSLKNKVDTKLVIYDVLGNKVASYINKTLPEGVHKIKIDGNNFASGTYIYQLIAGNFSETKKMLLLK